MSIHCRGFIKRTYCILYVSSKRFVKSIKLVVCVVLLSYLDQSYSSSTPNFAVGSVRRRAAAGGEVGKTRHHQPPSTVDACHREPPTITAPSAPDLATRGDTLLSPRVSPLLWFQQCLLPSLIVTSDDRRRHGKHALASRVNSTCHHQLVLRTSSLTNANVSQPAAVVFDIFYSVGLDLSIN